MLKKVISRFFSGKKILLVILLLSVVLLIAEETLSVKRNHSVLREGPGSFYPVISTLKVNTQVTVLQKKGKWYQVQVGNKVGYVSSKVFKEKKSRKNLEKMGEGQTEIEVAQTGLTAGVKGFAEKFSKKLKADTTFISYFMNYHIDPKSYKKFKKKTYKKISYKKARRHNHLPPPEKTEYYTFSEKGLGLAIAAKLASMGLLKDKKISDYLNNFVNLVVDASDGYDQTFKVFILNIDNPNAYSCPGGIIFITKGMLETIDNESELACVLGHEIAHIIRKHGMKEVERRVNDIYAEKAFDELDTELEEIGHTQDEKVSMTEKELEELSADIYETIVNGRLKKYEAEADRLGILYALRAGFNPNGMINLLERMENAKIVSNNEHYSPKEIEKRIVRVKSDLRHLKIPRKTLVNRKRYKKYGGSI